MGWERQRLLAKMVLAVTFIVGVLTLYMLTTRPSQLLLLCFIVQFGLGIAQCHIIKICNKYINRTM